MAKAHGICPECDKRVPKDQLVPAPDPYRSELEDDDTPVVECDDCREHSAMQI